MNPGDKISHYRIESLLGGGGMGKVFLAKDLSLGRRVVLKFLHPENSGDHTAAERFRREARTASALNHPGICTIHEISEHDGQPFIVMEWLEGQSLRDLLAARRLSIDEMLTLAIEIADALDAAHRAGVVHRDIKPGNIFVVTAGGRAKLLDFGLAKLEPAGVAASPQHPTIADDEYLTETGTLLGTVAYMSPEQARGDRLDHRTDLFSFGVVLYEMATGTVPFKGSNAAVVLHEVLSKSPTPPVHVNAAVPPELDRVITKALEKDRNLRCQSAAEMLSDLKRLKRDSSNAPALRESAPAQVAADNSAADRSDVRVVADLLKRRRIVFALTAMALVLAFIGVFYVGSLRQPVLPVTSLEEITMERLTTSGNAILGATSPDGKFVAYVQQEGNIGSLWIRLTATNTHREVVPAERGVSIRGVTVTPDGNFLDYVRIDPSRTPGLWRVPFIGGVPKQLIDNVYSPVGWSPDGQQMAFVRSTKDSTPTSLVITDADGSNEQVLLTLSDPKLRLFSVAMPGNAVPAPAWSPDGHVIAALSLDTSGRGLRGRTVFVRVSDASILDSPEQGGVTGLAWIDNSSLLINRVADSFLQLWRVTYPDNKLSRVTTDLSTYTGISLNADRTSAVTGRTEVQGSIWIGDGTGQKGDENPQPVAERAMSGTMFVLNWAGDRVLFTGTGSNLMVLAPGRTQPQTVIEKAASGVATSDGSTIVYLSTKAGAGGSLWRADASGGHASQLEPGNHLFPQIVDDKYVVYTDGALQPWIMPLAGGEKPKLIRNGIQGNFFVSLDGKSMQYADNSDPKQSYIVICDLPDCTETLRLKPPPGMSMRRWAPNRAIAFVREGNIWIQQLDGTPPSPLTQFKDNRLIVDFAWSRDGKRLAIARMTESRNIVLLKGLKPKSH